VQWAFKAAGAPGADTALNALRDAVGAAYPAGETTEASGRQRPRSSEQEEVRTG
jgi:shikimate kinase